MLDEAIEGLETAAAQGELQDAAIAQLVTLYRELAAACDAS